MKFINDIHSFILRGIKPNITFILKVSSSAAKKDCLREKPKIDMIIFHNPFTQKLKIAF